MTIYQSGGRFIAPIDPSLDPVTKPVLPPASFLGREMDTGRVRSRSNPVRRASVGDFGPALYWNANDAYLSDAGFVILPSRVDSRFDLRAQDSISVQDAFASGDPEWAGARSIEFAEGLTASLRMPEAPTGFFSTLKSFEVVIVCCLQSNPVLGETRLFGFTKDQSTLDTGTDICSAWATIHGAALSTKQEVELGVRKNIGTQRVRSAPLRLNRLSVVHLVCEADEANIYINGVRSAFPSVAGAGAFSHLLHNFSIGADETNTVPSAPMRVHEVALYPRALTRAERLSIFRGYHAPNASVPVFPTLDDVLDTTVGSWQSWYADRDYVIEGGVVASSDTFVKAGGSPTIGQTAAGRKFVVFDGASDLNAPGTYTKGNAEPCTFACGFKSTNAQQNVPFFIGGDGRVEHRNTGIAAIVFNSTYLEAAALGVVTNKQTTVVGRQDGAGGGQISASAFVPGDPTYPRVNASIAMVNAGYTDALAVGAANPLIAPHDGPVFFGFFVKRTLNTEEIETVLQFTHSEYNVT